jgi:hypothetical protein
MTAQANGYGLLPSTRQANDSDKDETTHRPHNPTGCVGSLFETLSC